MINKALHLSSNGLKNIILNEKDHEKEFRFIFFQREIKTNKINAEFISPVISHLHQCDPTINSMNIEDIFIKKSNQSNVNISESAISSFEELLKGSPIDIKEKDEAFFRYLSIILGNDEMYHQIVSLNPNCIQNRPIDELIDEVNFYDEYSRGQIEYDDILNRLSNEFSTLEASQIKKLPKTVLYSILQNAKFESEDEDKLFDLVSAIESDDREERKAGASLYEEIDFSKLSSEKVRQFLSEFDYNDMTGVLWRNLCVFMCGIGGQSRRKSQTGRKFEFDGKSENRLKGIIYALSKEGGGNVADKGIVNVTSSSTNCIFNKPQNAVDLDNASNYFASNDFHLNQWIQYDFKEKRIRPTHYSIRTRHDHAYCNPQSWVIEVSNTGNNDDWRLIDKRENVASLSKSSATETFDIQTQLTSNESYRYIRLRQTGKSTGDYNYLVISSLEYFGYLFNE